MVLHILRSKKVTKKVLTVVLILIIPAFILWGVGSITNRPKAIGKIGNKTILPEVFEKSRQGIRAQVLFTYAGDFNALTQILQNRSLLNFMAWERLILLDAAKKHGIKISNEKVLAFILAQPLFQKSGSFSEDAYKYILRNTLSIAPRQFEELIRENLMVKALRQDILKNVTVNREELFNFYREINDKVKVSFILINKDNFSSEISVSKDEALKYYNSNKDLFYTKPKVWVEYIELPFSSSTEKSSVVRKIEKIYQGFNGSSGDLAQLSESFETKYGKTEPFAQDEVIPGVPFLKGFQDTAFKMEINEVSSPVFSGTDKGSAYIIRKIGEIPPKLRPFKEVEQEITALLVSEKCIELAAKQADRFYTDLVDNSKTLEEIAATLGVKVQSSGMVSSSDYIENIGPAKKIVSVARTMKEGSFLHPVVTKNGAILIRVDNVLPAGETVFNQKKDALESTLLSKKQIEAMESWFKKNRAKVSLYVSLDNL